MKRKKLPNPEPVIPTEILEKAKQSLDSDKLKKDVKACIVCGAECVPNSSEQLCWVCRRLKISAWHENEQQMPAQE